MRAMRLGLLFTIAIAGCNSKGNPFAPVPECKGATVTSLMGDRQLVVSTLSIADANEGFDLDQNGGIDNKLSALGALANTQIGNAFTKTHNIVIPIELWGYTGESSTTCTKLAFYVGKFNKDRDGDGSDSTWDIGKSDCMDTDPAIHPGATEVPTSRVDSNCKGYADGPMPGAKPTDTMDLDGDGFSLAQGDCDDRSDAAHLALAKTRHPGAKDICDDGIDQDCDGIVDNDPSCDPFAQNQSTVFVLQSSFDAAMNPLITFKDGAVKQNVYSAGPDVFNFMAPIQGFDLNLVLSGAHLQMSLADAGGKTNAMSGLLGGVIEAVTMAQITGLKAGSFIKPDQSLLDAVMLGGISNVIGLDSDKDGHPLVDIDVDGDGIETFWQETPTPGMSAKVDTCKDGDGTIVKSMPGAPCALAKDLKGNYRFVDGLSIALKFQAVPAKISPMILAK